ncbi:adenine deaminase [Saccharibacillus sp. O23]|uniref:adenine deaminase n=1 Tax=Saccharibacillus sp. O23 TaxID=2009338 RepID=UPI000B4E4C99|nr:adenine deaminase [Saccharibacillus sp. O23]OWR27729.1 adenine deaminase [Saccharibacillus sp. O23]
MSTNLSNLNRVIAAAGKRVPADLVIANGRILNVFTGGWMRGDIAVTDGMIVGIGEYEGRETVDAEGRVVVPGFIDGHVHIESTMLLPSEFAKVSLRHGVTTVVTDPHEIANVAGEDGIRYLLGDAEEVPLDLFVMLPSCVPATPTENNGANLTADKLSPFLSDPRVLGLAEVMDFPSVANASPGMLAKLDAVRSAGGHIDGHAAGIGREDLNIYRAADIRTDHEAVNAQEALDRLELGMYLMVREGTVAKDLKALLPVITERNSRRCLFVTDDVLLDDLIELGSIDHAVRLAIAEGLDPIIAVQMATLNAAECFGLRRLGAVAPGYQADFLLLDDLNDVSIHRVYKKGRCVFEQRPESESNSAPHTGSALPGPRSSHSIRLPDLNAKPVTAADLAIPLRGDSRECHIIEVVPGSLITGRSVQTVDAEDGFFAASTERDLLKMAVVERHRATGNVGAAIVQGFGLKRGAIATTVAHDSHNIVAVGVSDRDILAAIDHVVALNGGLVVIEDGELIASLPLPVAGLMSNRSYAEVYEELKILNRSLLRLGASEDFNLFLMLSFLTLTVIPELKLTDQGLFEFSSGSYIDVALA